MRRMIQFIGTTTIRPTQYVYKPVCIRTAFVIITSRNQFITVTVVRLAFPTALPHVTKCDYLRVLISGIYDCRGKMAKTPRLIINTLVTNRRRGLDRRLYFRLQRVPRRHKFLRSHHPQLYLL